MAGRFVFQKLASGMSRSTSRLGVHASFSARGTAPVIARASEAGIRTLSDVCHGAGVVVPNNPAIHGYAARYLSSFPCSRAATKAGWSTTGMPSSIINQKKSAFVDSLGSLKQTYSTGTSNEPCGAKLPNWRERFYTSWKPNRETGVHDMPISLTMFGLASLVAAACFVPWPPGQRRSGKGQIARHCSSCKCLDGPSKS